MNNLYVVDTNVIVSYFGKLFNDKNQISPQAKSIIDKAFDKTDGVRLIFPSIVFVEIFSIWCKTEEQTAKIRYELLEVINQQENMAIVALEREVLENFINITDIEPKHNFDNHDKIVLATAMMYEATLLTIDRRLIRYNRRKKVIPNIIS